MKKSLQKIKCELKEGMTTKRLSVGSKCRIENGVLHIISGGSEYINIETGETINPQHNVIHQDNIRSKAIKWARKQS
jgi:hypothetical protein